MKSKATWLALAVAALALAAPVHANAPRVTEGDATAVLEAFGNGGWAVLNHARVVEGAPADGLVSGLATIRPFDLFNGKHYCELDWHTLVIADIEGGGPEFTHSDAVAAIERLSVELSIDGAPVAATQTAVKAFLNPEMFGLESAYYAQWGRVLAPTDLGPGKHTIGVVMRDGKKLVLRNTISIVVDRAGTGVCA